MRYISVEWAHNFPNEPVKIFSEIDECGWECRKVEVFPDGSYGYASGAVTFGGSVLSETKLPPIDEIEAQKVFKPSVIGADEFELIWNAAVAVKP